MEKSATYLRGPLLVMAAILAVTTVVLRTQGRLWRCASGDLRLWVGDAWSSHTSQHLFDPYSFTHILHGVAFCGLLTLLAPRLPLWWRLCGAIAIEAAWEVLENSAFVINRYRTATVAQGYQGDTIINSLGDIVACAFGFALAWRLGWRRSLVLFVVTEAVLLWWIRDSLLLNIVMLIHPSEAIKAWQMGH